MTWLDWYNSLAKPSWTPAPATIGLIWQILYPIIIFTFGFVFVQVIRGKLSWYIALPFAINLIANLIFTPIQFGWRNLPLAALDILIVLGTIIWMIVAIWSHYRWVALAQVPYLVWVSIATVLHTFYHRDELGAISSMIIRLTQNLATKIKAGTLKAVPLSENPYADWSAQLFTVKRSQFVLLSNTSSLFSTILFGQGISNDSKFIERAFYSIRDLLEEDGQAFVFHRFIVPESGTVRFAKTLNRSVIGSMNELFRHAADDLLDDDAVPSVVGMNLNDILLSHLATESKPNYGKPRECFRLLTKTIEPK